MYGYEQARLDAHQGLERSGPRTSLAPWYRQQREAKQAAPDQIATAKKNLGILAGILFLIGLFGAPVAYAIAGMVSAPRHEESFKQPVRVIAEAQPVVQSRLSMAQVRAATGRETQHVLDREAIAIAVYYESALEPRAGQVAVACVILARVRDHRFPATITAVVYQPRRKRGYYQFSAFDPPNSHPGARGRHVRLPDTALGRSIRVLAGDVMAGRSKCSSELQNAVYYFNPRMVRRPVFASWIRRFGDPVVKEGNHWFFESRRT